MIESINPTGLMEFTLAVANWAVQRPASLEDELEQVKNAIHTFCVNNDDPIYAGVDVLCETSINMMIQVMTNEPESEIVEEPDTKEETAEDKDNGIGRNLESVQGATRLD